MAAVDLVFANPPLTGPPWALVFGEADAAATPSRTCDLDGTFDALVLEAQARILSPVTLDASFDGPTLEAYARPVVSAVLDAGFAPLEFEAAAIYDNRVTRYLQGAVSGQHNPAIPAEVGLSAPHGISQSQRGGTVAPWQTAAASRKTLDAGHSTTLQTRRLVAALWQLATQHRTDAQARHQVADKRVMDARTGYDLAQPWQYLTASSMQTGIPLRNQLHSHWQPADHRQHTHGGRSGASLRRWGRQFELARWQQGRHPLTGRSYPPIPASPKDPCYLPDPNLLFDAPWSSLPNLVFICERHPVTPVIPGQVVVPIQRVYIVLNTVSLRRVDGDIPLPNFGMSMSLDRDSWTWSFSATLPPQTLADLAPSSEGDPVEVEALVNGTAYRFLVESRRRSRTFGKDSISIAGRGKSAYLDTPYAAVQNFSNVGAARTAQQLAADALTLNGVSLGWDVDWQLTDWLVPAGSWSHQGSYISALNAIAAAAGGYVQPVPSAQGLRILPAYPDAPWAWGAVTPDYELPADVTISESVEWVERARYNRVYVSGQRSGDPLGRVTRSGTAGDLEAPMVTDALITHAAAARQRGTAVLSNTGAIARVGIKLPVLAETGIIVPGKYIRYTDGGVSRFGITRGVQVDAGMPEVWQSLEIETHG
ncbi:MAG: hypothetical protein ABJA84_00040 [Polaromonas sp.]